MQLPSPKPPCHHHHHQRLLFLHPQIQLSLQAAPQASFLPAVASSISSMWDSWEGQDQEIGAVNSCSDISLHKADTPQMGLRFQQGLMVSKHQGQGQDVDHSPPQLEVPCLYLWSLPSPSLRSPLSISGVSLGPLLPYPPLGSLISHPHLWGLPSSSLGSPFSLPQPWSLLSPSLLSSYYHRYWHL